MVATHVSWQLIQFSYNLLVNLRRSSTSSVTTLDSYSTSCTDMPAYLDEKHLSKNMRQYNDVIDKLRPGSIPGV